MKPYNFYSSPYDEIGFHLLIILGRDAVTGIRDAGVIHHGCNRIQSPGAVAQRTSYFVAVHLEDTARGVNILFRKSVIILSRNRYTVSFYICPHT